MNESPSTNEFPSSSSSAATSFLDVSQIHIEEYLTPITGPNSCGDSLRYDPLYDQIRTARREDDPTLSRGIWQFDLKKADWITVEKLASEALKKRSKDLQIAGWLGESWVTLYGIPGFIYNIRLIRLLSEKFWDKLYPTLEEGDSEFRSQFFDWYDHTMMKHLVKIPIIGDDLANQAISLADWRSAFRFDSVIKREPDSNKLIQKAVERGQITLKQFYTFIKRLSTPFIHDRLQELETAFSEFNALKNALNTLMPDSTMAFNELNPTLEDLKRVYQTEFDQRLEEEKTKEPLSSPAPQIAPTELQKESQEAPPPFKPDILPRSNAQDITREQAYQSLSEIMVFLQKTEPHSIAPQLLSQLITWKDKSITQIFSELGSSPEEMVLLMRFLGLVETPK